MFDLLLIRPHTCGILSGFSQHYSSLSVDCDDVTQHCDDV